MGISKLNSGTLERFWKRWHHIIRCQDCAFDNFSPLSDKQSMNTCFALTIHATNLSPHSPTIKTLFYSLAQNIAAMWILCVCIVSPSEFLLLSREDKFFSHFSFDFFTATSIEACDRLFPTVLYCNVWVSFSMKINEILLLIPN